MLALVVPRGHGDNQCREQCLLLAREFSSEGIDRYGVVQINGEILPTEKLTYPFIAAPLIDDEDHRIEPQGLSDHVVYKDGLSRPGRTRNHRVRGLIVEEIEDNGRTPPAEKKKHGPDGTPPVAKHGKSIGEIVRRPAPLTPDKSVIGRIVAERQ